MSTHEADGPGGRAATHLEAVSRRDALRGIGATLASSSAWLAGCTRAPAEKIVPYGVQPEDVTVGEPALYASAMTVDGYAVGTLVLSHEGRPTKIEGNPDHPASLGACGAMEQAAVLELYSPRRQREVLHHGRAAAAAELEAALRRLADPAQRGRGVHLVMSPTSAPSVDAQLSLLRARLPELSVHYHSALSRMNVWRGAQQSLGRVLEPRWDLRRSDVILALDADFLAFGPGRLALARHFAERRRVLSAKDEMNRLYAVEPALSVSGQVADHRLALRDSEMPAFVAELLLTVARQLGSAQPALTALQAALASRGARGEPEARFLNALARDLVAHRGAALVIVGDRQPPAVHAAAHALNSLLASVNTCVSYAPSPILDAGSAAHSSLVELRAALEAGAVEALVVLDVDLLDCTAADASFRSALKLAKNSFFFGTFANATARACRWSAPHAHWLESWADTRAFDGSASIVQPLLAPLYGGRTVSEVLSLLLGEASPSAHDALRAQWSAHFGHDFEVEWPRALRSGVITGSASAAVAVAELAWDWSRELERLSARAAPALELCVHPDNRILDGRFGENPWLLELPDPVTKLTWQNAALLGAETAAGLGVATGDVVTIEAAGTTREVAVVTVPGQAEGAVSLSLGWGRAGLTNAGVNALQLVSAQDPWRATAQLVRGGRRRALPITQAHQTPEGLADSFVACATLQDYRRHPDFTKPRRKRPLSLYSAETPRAPQQWGMAIDLNACIGCAACVIACQAENNIPTVGADGVLAGREMHWLRVDRYVLAERGVVLQPMACQHCEHAPCEYVCPTGATVHSSDGLNQMVYNRCVGTRFCSNNCPYKVRRFNWFNYQADAREPALLAHNPDVTVRARGVMEKCTYCVQRIRRAEIRARLAGQRIADGALMTACEQTCPSNAIVFGDVADPTSRVAKLHRNERAFEALNELGTLPRTRYLAKLKNPNPELA